MYNQKSNRISVVTSIRIRPSTSQSVQTIGENLKPPFSCVLSGEQNQKSTYTSTCANLISSFIEGNNCTLFAYGQTGSGKTHTLLGPPNSFHDGIFKNNANEAFMGSSIPPLWGIIPRVVLELLNKYVPLSLTAVEIYLDNCYDLTSENKEKITIAGFGKSSKVSGRGAFQDTTTVKRDKSGSSKIHVQS